MNFAYLFTSFDGRIGRAQWWVGTGILLVVSRLLAGIIAGFMTRPTSAVLISLVYFALFRPGYAVAAKRFQDRDKPGATALYGMVPGLIAVLLPAYGLHGSWQQPNSLGWICAFVEWGVSIWFLIELGLLKGSAGPNRFGTDRLDAVARFRAHGGHKVIGGRLAAYFAGAAGAAIMAALCNSIVWMISVPVALALFLLASSAQSWVEPGIVFKGAVVLIACAYALIAFLLATPFARLALRVWPVDPFGGRTARRRVVLIFGILCLVPVVAFFSLTLVGVLNSSVRFVVVGLRSEPIAYGTSGEYVLQRSLVRFGWSSVLSGVFGMFYWSHVRAARNIRRPFAMFLRRFSGFADRALVVDIIKSMPRGVPLAFVASRADQARNWDPFVWAFGGLRLLKPLRNLPVQIKTTDKDWAYTVERLLHSAQCVIIDLSDTSPSVKLERELIEHGVAEDRVVAVVDARRTVDNPSDQLLARAIPYSPSFLNSAVLSVGKVALILFIWSRNVESVWGWLPLLVVPFLIMPSVSRAERRAIRKAVRTAVHR